MTTISISEPQFRGAPLSELPGGYGLLQDSSALRNHPEALRERMATSGYLFLRGELNPGLVLEARDSILEALAAEGMLDPDAPQGEAVARSGVELKFRPDLATGNPAVDRLLYDGEMMAFWRDFLGGEVLHFDYTWLRAKAPADETVTDPHCDTVFMNRGTPNLYTAWTPLGSVPYEHGGLMILEGSQRGEEVLGEYWKMDVDEYCTNGPEAEAIESGAKQWQDDKRFGVYSDDAAKTQRQLGGHWLIAEYQPGDLLVFGMHTLHAAIDNQSRCIRLSTDSRYQRADEPADKRWVGPNIIGNTPEGKIGRIC